MKNSAECFVNKGCQYYPCHKAAPEEMNCLFCFCPFYWSVMCPGTPRYQTYLKDCSECVYPHVPENYLNIINELSNVVDKAKVGRV